MPSLLGRQSPTDHVNNVKNTFSSWDTCMAKAYCKWPVIVGIVVGSLILLSVIACIARCICCGAECACCCFKCATCCCGGGSRGGSKGHQRMKSDPKASYPTPYSAPPQNPYTAVAPASPMDARPANQQYRSAAMPAFAPAPVPEHPQYATFAAPGKPVNEDALPAMPTWNDGRDVHVEVKEPAPVPQKRGDMELSRLDTTGMAAVGGAAARRSPRSPHTQRSPTTDSYGFPRGYQNDSFVSAGPQRKSPGPNGRPYAQDEYRRGSPGPRAAQDGYAQNAGYDRRSPAQHTPYNDSHDNRDYYDPPAHQPQQRYNSPSPPRAAAHSPLRANNYTHNDYNHNQASPYDDFAPAPPQHRALSPGYTSVSDSTRYEPSSTSTTTAAYPGQQSYSPSNGAYPGQQTYQAFQPGVARKAVDGSYREV